MKSAWASRNLLWVLPLAPAPKSLTVVLNVVQRGNTWMVHGVRRMVRVFSVFSVGIVVVGSVRNRYKILLSGH
ncbi:MAG: hypothetical protein NWF00_05010 [Candidatus Bathyarchaeota archaeon]|nr:hypothetical protein [Candidatus Bathyarchaeota archaeon]